MKYLYIILSLLCVNMAATAHPQVSKTTLKGVVRDAVDGMPVVGASVYFPSLKQGTVTNSQGEYAFASLPAIKTTVQVSYVGHQTIIQTIDLHSSTVVDFTLHENNAMLGEVVVTGLTGNSLAGRSPSPVSVVSPRELQETSATNIVDAVSRQPGVAQITTGSGISKPVIRGLGYNRIVVVNDGIRQEGQQWGDEHGIEIDPQAVHSVEILKGPASLMYGSDAMAGVLVFHEEPVMPLGKMTAQAGGEYQSNQSLYNYTVDFAGNRGGLVWNWRWSEKDAGAYGNKYDSKVSGSQFHERALTGMLGLNRNWGYSHLKLSAYNIKPGLVEGERDEATGALEDSEAFQKIHHYKAVLDNSFLLGDGSIKAVVGYQQNRRREFEDEDEAGLDFKLHTVNYDVHYLSPDTNGWLFSTGVSGMWQHSENLGNEYLIPAYRLFDVGFFASSTYSYKRLSLSGGLRFDHRHLHSYSLFDEGEERFSDFTRNFRGLTGTVGAIYNLTEQVNMRLNISRGFRAPNLSELGSNGEHEGTFRYEVGNNGLSPEFSWQGDWGIDFSSDVFSVQLALFASHISNYIFLQKQLVGENIFKYTQGDARLWGGEALLDIHPVEQLHFENTFSMVNAVQLHQPDDAKYLPFTPAPRWISDLRYDIIRDGRSWLNNLYVSVGQESNFKQSHVHAANDTETATPAYTLFNMSAGTDFCRNGRRLCSVHFSVSNLTNVAYQSHLSRLKYGPHNPMTGRRGVYNMGRNIALKVVFPIQL